MRAIARTAFFGILSFIVLWVGLVYINGQAAPEAGENASRWALGIMFGMILEHVYGGRARGL